MPVLLQIGAGSVTLVACALFQIWGMAEMIGRLRRSPRPTEPHGVKQHFRALALLFAVLLACHTVHVYLWAVVLVVMGALNGYEPPIYFALITYTTLGYGDLTLSPDFRIFGTFAAVTGILSFGLSTAFLVSYLSRVIATMSE